MLRMVIIFGSLLLSGSLYAQSSNNLSLYLNGGSAVSFGDLSERAPYGFQGNAGLGLKPSPRSSPELEMVTNFQYSFFPVDEENNGNFHFILAGLDFRLRLHSAGSGGFYVTVGGGYAYTRVEESLIRTYLGSSLISERSRPEITEHNPYFSPGLGYEFGKSQGVSFYLEGRLLNIFGTYIKNNIMLPFHLGVKF